MEHRHLEKQENKWSIAIVESILERGSDGDIINLLKILRRDPHGGAAEAVRKSIPHLRVYGYPALLRSALEHWRIERDGVGEGS